MNSMCLFFLKKINEKEKTYLKETNFNLYTNYSKFKQEKNFVSCKSSLKNSMESTMCDLSTKKLSLSPVDNMKELPIKNKNKSRNHSSMMMKIRPSRNTFSLYSKSYSVLSFYLNQGKNKSRSQYCSPKKNIKKKTFSFTVDDKF